MLMRLVCMIVVVATLNVVVLSAADEGVRLDILFDRLRARSAFALYNLMEIDDEIRRIERCQDCSDSDLAVWHLIVTNDDYCSTLFSEFYKYMRPFDSTAVHSTNIVAKQYAAYCKSVYALAGKTRLVSCVPDIATGWLPDQVPLSEVNHPVNVLRRLCGEQMPEAVLFFHYIFSEGLMRDDIGIAMKMIEKAVVEKGDPSLRESWEALKIEIKIYVMAYKNAYESHEEMSGYFAE